MYIIVCIFFMVNLLLAKYIALVRGGDINTKIADIISLLIFCVLIITKGVNSLTIIPLILIPIYVYMSLIDIKYRLIYDEYVFFILQYYIIHAVILNNYSIKEIVIGALYPMILMSILCLATGGGLGGGDIKLFTLIGMIVGYPGILLVILMSSLIALLYLIIPLIKGKIKSLKYIFSYGPFIAISFYMFVFLLWR
ncbi:prepilin peptidase [Tissierella carlieri]|uniref:Prepilin peptidase n=1 Tax=Tissierella carlieri TaxID=689904 RepID=A0ABT1SEF6_9FIRM|nr:prepilin peptidase [Tissierella carlieri]MCQ4924866.1 prepilin peptidase [Tissierella carlieri]